MDFAPVAADQAATSVDPVKTVVCGPNQVKMTRPTRVLFVVDQSGSNVNGPYEAPGMATDPQKTFRTGVMQDFYQSNQSKATLSWGLAAFNDTSAVNLMKHSAVAVPFSSSAADFSNALTAFTKRDDVGQTPYKAALTLVQQTIANDLPTAPKYVNYLVAFLTDGYPTDYCPSGTPAATGCPGQILESNIDADVQAMVNAAKGSIQFSTVYYGKPDSDAAKRLQRMASIGGGEFVDTNTTSQVNLNDIMTVEQEVCVEK